MFPMKTFHSDSYRKFGRIAIQFQFETFKLELSNLESKDKCVELF